MTIEQTMSLIDATRLSKTEERIVYLSFSEALADQLLEECEVVHGQVYWGPDEDCFGRHIQPWCIALVSW